jgi:hypothetical protein
MRQGQTFDIEKTRTRVAKIVQQRLPELSNDQFLRNWLRSDAGAFSIWVRALNRLSKTEARDLVGDPPPREKRFERRPQFIGDRERQTRRQDRWYPS